jgi:hypothetical protein
MFEAEQLRSQAKVTHKAEASEAPQHLTGSERQVFHLQRLAGNDAVGGLIDAEDDRSGVEAAVQGGAQSLDGATRTTMEAALGADFTGVRVHTDADAAASAQRLQAKAYTVGSDIVFAQGAYDPSSASGQRTIAHELTHVVQQASGPVDGTDTGTGVRLSDPDDRFERAAEATAEDVVNGRAVDASAAGAAAGIQRQEQDEDETLQGVWVQRLDEDELLEDSSA